MHSSPGDPLNFEEFFFRKTQQHRFLSGGDSTASIYFTERSNCIDLLCLCSRKTQLHRFVVLVSSVGSNCIDMFLCKGQLHRIFPGEDSTASIFFTETSNCIDLLCVFFKKGQPHRFFLLEDLTRPNCKYFWFLVPKMFLNLY